MGEAQRLLLLEIGAVSVGGSAGCDPTIIGATANLSPFCDRFTPVAGIPLADFDRSTSAVSRMNTEQRMATMTIASGFIISSFASR